MDPAVLRNIRKSLHWTSCKGFTPKPRKRLCADAVKSTHLKPSCHLTGTTTAPHSTPECDLRYQRCLRTTKRHLKTRRSIIPPPSVMRSRTRAMGQGFRLLDPVRGLIRPSIPLPFHWRPETRSQTSSPRAMNFFLFSTFMPTIIRTSGGLHSELWSSREKIHIRKQCQRTTWGDVDSVAIRPFPYLSTLLPESAQSTEVSSWNPPNREIQHKTYTFSVTLPSNTAQVPCPSSRANCCPPLPRVVHRRCP